MFEDVDAHVDRAHEGEGEILVGEHGHVQAAGEDGCTFEMPVAAAGWAANPINTGPNGANEGFIRDDALLVIVIIIYGAIGIAGHKLGFEWGLSVTLFPLIILSWTIERMSILWDEEGAHEVDDFWEPITARRGACILEPERFYIFASRERIRIPPHLAAEMLPICESLP